MSEDLGRQDHPPEDEERGRAARQATNLARHLNERHPDTVLFLARYAAGHRQATTANLLSVDTDGITLTIDGSEQEVRVPFDTAIASSQTADARSRLRRLLEATRAANSGIPLTSLEKQFHPRASAAPSPHS
jgi:putative heme iron utilization protein